MGGAVLAEGVGRKVGRVAKQGRLFRRVKNPFGKGWSATGGICPDTGEQAPSSVDSCHQSRYLYNLQQ